VDSPTIVTVTLNPAVDENTTVQQVVSDHKLRCDAPRYDPGGGGINVARAIVRLGGEALAIYPAGGPAGSLLGSLLDAENVARDPVPISGWTRRNLNVREESTGRHYRFCMPGPELSEGEWRECLVRLRKVAPPPRFVVASGSLPPGAPADFYAWTAGIARDLGARFIVDSAGASLRAALAAGVFLAKPSLREFEELTARRPVDETGLEGLARDLVQSGSCELLVLSLGAGGVLWTAAHQQERLVAPAVPVASNIGAGDSLVAGIVLSLERGWPVGEAMRFGVAAGAATVMNPGTQLCRREDTERLYEQIRAAAVPSRAASDTAPAGRGSD
jgi:6-phosphofructokinase 2